MRVYLDNAATTKIAPEVLEAMLPFMREHYGNPSSIHAQGRRAKAAIERARKIVAQHLNASIGEIFFTSGGTESNNMAIKCAIRDLGVTRIISSPIEHHCILHTLEDLPQNIEVEMVKILEDGKVDYEDLENRLKSGTDKTLVSLMYANNEIGVLLDLKRVSDLCAEHSAYFHTDSVQTMGHFPMDVKSFPVHFMSGSAHKFHGPKGVGFIYINQDSQIKSFLQGGAQERNMRAGTENIYGIIGLAKAFEMAIEEMDQRRTHIQEIRSNLAKGLLENFENIRFNTDWEGESLYTVLNVSFPPSEHADLLLLNLDIAGISASGGSACSSGSEKGSHVIEALQGKTDRKNIRFSFSHYNTAEEIDFLLEALKKIVTPKNSEVTQ
ncbi:MAG: cysteine desulfurase [Saprospiraceae bacterium]|nr:cysteine desulfurase [Saprospiraceae bacterium]